MEDTQLILFRDSSGFDGGDAFIRFNLLLVLFDFGIPISRRSFFSFCRGANSIPLFVFVLLVKKGTEGLQAEMVINGHKHGDISGKFRGCEDYIEALEEERRKIRVFQRELPLCLELVTQAIDSCKQQLFGTAADCNLNGQSDCNSDQTSSEVPVLEEFIPIKRRSICEEQESKKARTEGLRDEEKNNKKSDWLRSAQLWNQGADPPTKEDSPRRVAVVEVKRAGAFHPFKKEKPAAEDGAPPQEPATASPPALSASSSAGTGKKEDRDGLTQRKARRCWSPELHRRFLQALQQLGGPHVATPKQIRELMKVDGLTNDEVKSHLQKYRLHTRRPSPPKQPAATNPPQQFAVVVGGIWAVPPEYAAVPAAANPGDAASGVAVPSNEIYVPTARKSPNFQQECSKRSCSSQDDGDLPASSSSTQTTTASPPP